MSKRSKQQRDRIFGGMIIIICLGVIASVVYLASGDDVEVVNIDNVIDEAPSNNNRVVTSDAVTTNEDPVSPEDTTEQAVTIQGEAVDITLLQEAEADTAGEITTYRFGETQTLVVAPASFSQLLFSESGAVSESDTELDGMPAKQYVRTSAKDGSEYSILQVVTDDQVYHLQGDAEFISEADDYISFNK